MDLALLSAILGSICLAGMIIFDRLMMNDCYQNKPDHAWFISSSIGALFGLLATLITWMIVSLSSEIKFSQLVFNAIHISFSSAILMIIVGIINIQVMRHYFKLFIPNHEKPVSETTIAVWLASVPIFIFITLFTINNISIFENGFFDNLKIANVSPIFGLSIALTVCAIVGFEFISNGKNTFRFERSYEIAKMVGCIVLYTILSSAILHEGSLNIVDALSLQPYYWIGYAAGVRYIFLKKNRDALKNTLQQLVKYGRPIIIVEIIGMLVYYFEFFALAGMDPTLVNLINSAHIIPVFIFAFLISKIRTSSLNNLKESSVYLFGVHISNERLAIELFTREKVTSFCLVVITLLISISFL